ncbi:MAG TPA: LysR family transcriptional regulator [Rhizomicrobium sp.]|nr:LysR family transcriptional regulator [Rhizomicrobium sp.]
MPHLSIRVDFEPSGSSLGPGMAQLLERVAAQGSISSAAASMGMSYRKAWLLVQEMQSTFNGAVVISEIGGNDGGGSKLTELGANLLKTYRRIEARAVRGAEADLENLAALVKATAAPRRGLRRKLSKTP